AGAGLKYTYADSQYSDTVAAGSVISQTKSGETVAAGTTITLTLSKGKQQVSKSVNKTLSLGIENAKVVDGSYTLKGSDGQTYASGTVTSAEVAVSGTMNCASGKITVTWKYTVPSLDGDGNEVEGEIQTKTETVEVQ
ncbi:PASTA domain-containing protein, partial [Agathobacter sp.]|uniref:PASTA domain-containing protein n=1 Tax=Agathobacter sp. TaxID=2021311 RepID=UPI002A91A340